MIIGLVVNPVAGLGGPAGLKGSDGPEIQARALALGSTPRAGERAVAALRALPPGTCVRTVAGAMGEESARTAGVRHEVRYVPEPPTSPAHAPTSADYATTSADHAATSVHHAVTSAHHALTSAADTRKAVAALADVDLLLFTGGDGTARDILDARPEMPVLGIPAGVKVYSGCFAISPFAAGSAAASFDGRTVEAEVVDLDEDAYREGRVGARLYGTLRVPAGRRLSGRKVGSSETAPGSAESIAREVVSRMEPGAVYALGPGATTQAVGRELGLALSPLGVDLIKDRSLLAVDVTETDLFATVAKHPTYGVLSVIGGQGFVAGRGNQQFSPRVLTRLAGVMVLATQQKLAALGGRPLLADTGDPVADAALSGHTQVITGYRESVYYRVASASTPHVGDLPESRSRDLGRASGGLRRAEEA